MAYQKYFHTQTRQESVLFPFPNAHHYPKPPISGPITSTTAANNEIVSAANNTAELQIQICPQHTQRAQPGADIKTKVIYIHGRARSQIYDRKSRKLPPPHPRAYIQNPPSLRVKQRSESRRAAAFSTKAALVTKVLLIICISARTARAMLMKLMRAR